MPGWAFAVVVLVGAALAGCSDAPDVGAGSRCAPAPPFDPRDTYAGSLVDAFTLLSDDPDPAALACALTPGGVERAALVVAMDPGDSFATESAYRDAVEGNEGLFIPVARLPAGSGAAEFQRIEREVALFFPAIWVTDVGQATDSLYGEAARRDLFVGGLLGEGGNGLDAALGRLGEHPSVKLLAVVDEPTTALAGAVRDHDRLFLVIAAPERETAGDWLTVIQAAPDRVMWGSGAGAETATDAPSYGEVVAEARAFLFRLPAPLREKVAAANARRLLGAPAPPVVDA